MKKHMLVICVAAFALALTLIQALLTFRSVLVARAIPCWIASSKLSVDVEFS